MFISIATPENLKITLDALNTCTLSWTPPRIATRHGTIIGYHVRCSNQYNDVDAANTSSNTLQLLLKRHAEYECCVFAINEIGEGIPVCKTLVTHESGILLHSLRTHTGITKLARSKLISVPIHLLPMKPFFVYYNYL